MRGREFVADPGGIQSTDEPTHPNESGESDTTVLRRLVEGVQTTLQQLGLRMDALERKSE